MSLTDKIQQHTAARVERNFNHLCQEFGFLPDPDGEMLKASLAVIEDEYGVRMGFLRPSDPLTLFLDSSSSRNPITKLFSQAAAEDRASELSFRLKQQRRKLGLTAVPRLPPRTLLDYVSAWSGKQ